MTGPTVPDDIARVFRAEYGRIVASLARRFGDLDIAEDAASEALVAAIQRWPVDGFPANPGAWLTTTAANRALDRLRRESHRLAKYQAAHMITDDSPPADAGPIEDDRLRLIFTCCHPALATEARVALTLRLLGGLTVAEIANAFLVPETTMAQRITRAKAKIRQARIPYRIPADADIEERMRGVLAVVYLIFNEGYLSSGASDAVRSDLIEEAIRLGAILHELAPADSEATGLLGLMQLIDARRTTRVAGGEVVTLANQDRSRWDSDLIRSGTTLVRRGFEQSAIARRDPGQYLLMAAINAVHNNAADARDTDWARISQLYNMLAAVAPSPIVELNRAVAIAEVDGPQVALSIVDRLGLEDYHAWHVARAEFLRRLGRRDEAISAYEAALALVDNPAERKYLSRRVGELRN